MKPVVLGPNQPARFYRGGERIAALRGVPTGHSHTPEDWIGSTTTLFGSESEGLYVLPDGQTLRAAMAADPGAYFGAEHLATLGPEPGFLLKLLDAGERLPVHCHPGRRFAREHLGCGHGKTEGWVVVGAEGDAPSVYLGFSEPLERDVLNRLVSTQDPNLLDTLNRLEVEVGDVFLVPGGVPHAIGPGLLIVELQEPTDLSVLLEDATAPAGGVRDGHLGLGLDVALGCVDRTSWGGGRIEELRRRRVIQPGAATLFPAAADAYFRAEWVDSSVGVEFGAGFAILVVLDGSGWLTTAAGDKVRLAKGTTMLVPHAAGATEITGPARLVRCLPPDPTAVATW